MASVVGSHNGDLYNLELSHAGPPPVAGLVLCVTDLGTTFQRDTSEVQACRGDVVASGGWKTHILGDKSAEISAEGHIRMGNTWNSHTLFVALDTDQIMDFEIYPIDSTGAQIVGGQITTGQCFISNLELTFPNDDIAVYSLTLMVQGKPSSALIV
jgi:predicted secreted protein